MSWFNQSVNYVWKWQWMNRAVFALLAILFLLSVSSITGLIQTVKADGAPIYINANGSITPPTAPIYTADNITYTLTGNVTANADGIVIERDNIVLKGAGYTVTGSLSGNGTTLTNMSNVTINNIIIKEFGTGIMLDSSSNCTLSGNNVTTNKHDGIMLDSSSNCTLSGNNITHNDYGIDMESSSDNNTLSGNNVADSVYSIYFESSSNCTLSGNYVTVDSTYGIWLDSSSNCTLSGNNVTNGNNGIALDSSSNNVLSGNNITANTGYGIYLSSSSNCTLSGNNVTDNDYGIWLASSSNNFIFHNDFVNNTNQVYTDGLANVWDNGSSGNYWSDYVTKYPNATQVDSSGVWNTPYIIDTNNTDHYPLTGPYATVVIPEFPSIQATMFFILLTLLTVIIYKKKGVRSACTNN
jgi:parallel beta-helix repeat protein